TSPGAITSGSSAAISGTSTCISNRLAQLGNGNSMYESFDAFEYIEYLRRRWRVIAAACGVALLVVLPVSLLLPKRYTATASIVIDPPGGSDARIATAVSAVYLESLKTYERYATSDSLFELAIQRFHLDSGSAQSLKRRVL